MDIMKEIKMLAEDLENFKENLSRLEVEYRQRTSSEKPNFEGIDCYLENGVYQRQFFVFDEADDKEKINTIVVLVGVNYTQHQAAEKNIIPKKSDKAISTGRANIEQKLNLKDRCHILYTNLSPWITQKRWGKISSSLDRKRFLYEAARLEYIEKLLPLLEKFDNVVWIGHTMDIESNLREFFKRKSFKNIKWFLARNVTNHGPGGWEIKEEVKNPNE